MAVPPCLGWLGLGWLGLNGIAYSLDFVDRVELRADQDLLEAQLLDSLDAAAGLVERADKIDGCQFCQLRRFRTLGQVDRAIGEDGVLAAGLAVDFHAVFEVFPAA